MSVEELSILQKWKLRNLSGISTVWSNLCQIRDSKLARCRKGNSLRKCAARRLKTPKINIPSNEKRTISDFNNGEAILILSTETTFVMNGDYDKKIRNLLDLETYQRIIRDLTNSIMRKTNTLIKNFSIQITNNNIAKYLITLLDSLIGRMQSYMTCLKD